MGSIQFFPFWFVCSGKEEEEEEEEEGEGEKGAQD